jgi:DNA-binding transcriptional LysR family regulator
LVEVLPHLATDGMAINLIWLKRRQALPKVSALLEALAAGLVPSASKIQ